MLKALARPKTAILLVNPVLTNGSNRGTKGDKGHSLRRQGGDIQEKRGKQGSINP